MDYNEVRKRREMREMRNRYPQGGGYTPQNNRSKRRKNNNIILIVLVLILIAALITGGIILFDMVMPEKNPVINSELYAQSLQEQGEKQEEQEVPVYEPTPEPTPEPTIAPRRGTKESIPDGVWQSMQGRSWTQNPNVGYDDLMYLTIPHYGYDYEVTTGHMIVAADVADEVLDIFAELYDIKYPIERMGLVDQYFDGLTEQLDTPDRNSMGHNNTSAFYYRVVSGSKNLSQHAYGRAIDLNPKTNPWVSVSGSVSPRNATKYADRTLKKGTSDISSWTEAEQDAFIGNDTEVYRIFSKYGWEWGGEIWQSSYYDYQHFQKKR